MTSKRSAHHRLSITPTAATHFILNDEVVPDRSTGDIRPKLHGGADGSD